MMHPTSAVFAPFLLFALASISFVFLSALLFLVVCNCHFIQLGFGSHHELLDFLLLFLHHGDEHGILVGDLLDVLMLFLLFVFHLCFHSLKVHVAFFCNNIVDTFLSLTLCIVVSFAGNTCLFKGLLAVYPHFGVIIGFFPLGHCFFGDPMLHTSDPQHE